jgi:hypothetical protein
MEDRTERASKIADLNPDKNSYEAVFEFPAGTRIEGASVVVTCTGMKDSIHHDRLTIIDQGDSSRDGLPTLSITGPKEGGEFQSWTEDIFASGEVKNSQAKIMWLRLTDRGHDVIDSQNWTIETNDGGWQLNLSPLVRTSRRLSNSPGQKYCLHMSVWEYLGSGQHIRTGSGYFTVGG